MELPQPGIEPTPPAVEIQNLKRGQAELGSWDNQEITMSKKFCFFKIFIYLASPGPVCIMAGRIFSSGMQTLSCSMWDLVP